METKTSTTEVSNQKMSSLIVANKLAYHVPASISLYNSRQNINYPSQNNRYGPSETVIVHLSNSDIFVNGATSYLRFKVRAGRVLQPGESLSTGEYGSAAGIISRVRYIHSSGIELCHNQDVNYYSALVDHAQEDLHFWKNMAPLMGYGAVDPADKTVERVELKGSDSDFTEFAIPLNKIIPVFNSYDQNTLVPPMLLSGARLEISLASAEQAFVTIGPANAIPYEVSEVSVELDSYILSDAAFSVIEKMSSQSLIEYVYSDWEVLNSTTNVDRINMELTKSLGRATGVVLGCRDTALLSDVNFDYFRPLEEAKSVKEYQLRLNSLYMPATPADGIQSYLSALQYNGKHAGNYDLVDHRNAKVILQTLQRSDFLGASSGLPVNSSSSLRFQAEFQGAVNGSRNVTMYVQHMKIVTPVLYDKCVVSV